MRANVCRAIGKCCCEGVSARNLSCINIVDELLKYTRSKHQIVRDNIPLALSGLSEDPLNCVKIEALGFIPVQVNINTLFLLFLFYYFMLYYYVNLLRMIFFV